MSEWQHDPKGEDIIAQVAQAPLSIKRQAAIVLLRNGAKPRQIRRKLDISDRQMKVVERLWKAVIQAEQNNA
jgi:hypothetical protein